MRAIAKAQTLVVSLISASVLVACGGGGGGGGADDPGFPSVNTVSPQPLDDLRNGVTMEAYGFAQGVKYDATTGQNRDFKANFNQPRVRRATAQSGDDTYLFHFSKANIRVTVTLPESGTVTGITNRDTRVRFRPVPGSYTYTASGAWSFDRASRDFSNIMGPYTFGTPTTTAGLQSLGNVTVTYSGAMAGDYRSRNQSSGVNGDVTMSATFTPTGEVSTVITGSVTNLNLADVGGGRALNDLQFSGTGEGATFEGTITAQAGPGFSGTDFTNGADGPLVGQFTGPSAEEAGIAFRVLDGDRAMVGGIVVEQD